jgi:uncharacterized surface protein with fasciclin (FAS1) repeats
MRARSAALAPALLLLALVGAGCGGDDEAEGPTPTSAATATEQSSATTPADGAADAPTETPHADTGVSTSDSLSEQLTKNPDLRTLSTALSTAGLTSVLEKGEYTLFAPNNDAFTKLGTQLDTLLQPSGKADLVNILKFHVVEGKVRLRSLKDGELLTTLQGTRLRVTVRGGQTMIGNSVAKGVIVTPNAKASNGIIHTVDTVLRPKNGA